MMQMAVVLFLALSNFTLAAPQNDGSIFRIDADHSKLEIHVGTAGFFKAFGHDHLVSAKRISGQVRFSEHRVEVSSVTFVVESKSLEVLDPGEAEKDRAEVQSTMLGEKVLDCARFPEIKFASTALHLLQSGSDGFHLKLDGTLHLHGVEKTVSVPVRIHVTGEKLTAAGEVDLRQSEYGIVPIKVGGGTVRVKDELKIRFEISAVK